MASGEEQWTTMEQLILTHAILKSQLTWVAAARSIRQTSCIATHLSHKHSFFTPKKCAAEYVALVEQYTGKSPGARPRAPDFHVTLEVERELRMKRISELESLIAQSNTKIKVIEDDVIAINNATDENLEEVIAKMQIDTDQLTENSEETEPSDTDTITRFISEPTKLTPNSPSTDSRSMESAVTDVSYDSQLDVSVDNLRASGNFTKYKGKSLSEKLMSVWKICWRHIDGRVFREPVTDEVAPGYSSIISRPMDLSTIKKKIFSDEYTQPDDLWEDLKLMFTNAMVYNETGSPVYLMAENMMQLMKQEINLVEEALEQEPIVIETPRKRRLSRSHTSTNIDQFSSSSDGSPPTKRRKLKK